MKITEKQLRILSGLCLLAGAIVVILTKSYNANHIDDPNNFGKWTGIAIMIIGLILLAPWVKNKEQK